MVLSKLAKFKNTLYLKNRRQLAWTDFTTELTVEIYKRVFWIFCRSERTTPKFRRIWIALVIFFSEIQLQFYGFCPCFVNLIILYWDLDPQCWQFENKFKIFMYFISILFIVSLGSENINNVTLQI